MTLNNLFNSEVDCKIGLSKSVKYDKYQVTRLDNGLKIISEYIPHFRSISLGFWVAAGSISENLSNNGITHLIEHLLFKGTKKRSFKDIAIEFDSMGAEFNAFTDKENICIYADFIDTHLEKCLELLFDIVINPSFLPENIKTEKKVTFEEIKMVEDNLSDDIFNYFYKEILNGHPLSLPVLGSRKSILRLDDLSIWNYFNEKFIPENMIISAAGNIKHSDLVESIKKNIDSVDFKKNQKFCQCFTDHKIKPVQNVRKIYKRKAKAAHICYGGLGCNRNSSDKYPLSLFMNVLGGSMSSRLFQKIREERGLSYSIFASNIQYVDTGIIYIYASCSSKNAYKVLELIEKEIDNIKRNGIEKSEQERAKDNIKGNIVLNIEDISSRMARLGKGLLLNGKVLSIDSILKKIDSVKLEDLNDIENKYFQPDKMGLVMMGDVIKRRLK